MSQCPHCRGSRDDCSDPEKVWHMHRDVCWKTVAQEAAKFIDDEQYKDEPYHDGTFTRWSEKQSVEFPNRYVDGVTLWVADQPQSATEAG